MVEEVVNVEAKANFQPPSETREIDSKYPGGYKLSVQKDKDDANREHWDKAPKDIAKSHNSSSTNQPQTQAPKKDKHGNRQGGYPATGVNASEVAKKNKDKAKDLSHIKCYICQQKGHYVNKCPKKSKN